MNDVCNKYFQLMKKDFSDIIKTIIFYGSNIYNVHNSDLDVCIIVDSITSETQQKIINETLKFHLENNLNIDDEVPHTNKLIYTIKEVEDTLVNHPFLKNGEIVISDIIKSREFLSSKEMKKRLLLNILTTDHLVIGDSINEYEKRALNIILDVIITYFKIDNKSEEEILNCMYTNKYTGASGEMYLGYKKNHPEKDKYLRKKIHDILK